MSIEARLERLERKVRWMRRLGTVGVALVAAVFLLGQGKKEELPDLRAKSLTVVDEKGTVRAALGTDAEAKDRTYLRLADKDGTVRIRLAIIGGSAALSFSDEKGQERARLGTVRDGSPRLTFKDKNGKFRIKLTNYPEFGPELKFSDKDEKVTWRVPER